MNRDKSVLLGYEVGTGNEIYMEPMSWNYVAAFLDGEGSAWAGATKKLDGIGLQWVNTYKKILEEIQIFLKCGRIVPSGASELSKKKCWALVVRKWSDCLRISKELLPRCRVKREQIQKLIQFIENRKWRTNPRVFRHRPEITEEVLRDLYLIRKMTLREIAITLGCVRQTIWKKLKKFDIPIRNCSEAQLLFWSKHNMKEFRRY